MRVELMTMTLASASRSPAFLRIRSRSISDKSRLSSSASTTWVPSQNSCRKRSSKTRTMDSLPACKHNSHNTPHASSPCHGRRGTVFPPLYPLSPHPTYSFTGSPRNFLCSFQSAGNWWENIFFTEKSNVGGSSMMASTMSGARLTRDMILLSMERSMFSSSASFMIDNDGCFSHLSKSRKLVISLRRMGASLSQSDFPSFSTLSRMTEFLSRRMNTGMVTSRFPLTSLLREEGFGLGARQSCAG